jgi:hypothetical protein
MVAIKAVSAVGKDGGAADRIQFQHRTTISPMLRAAKVTLHSR